MDENTYHVVTLGCAKNDVDSSSMAQLLSRSGFRAVEQSRDAAVVVVNTCGFIELAREESYATLERLAAAKPDGQLLIAAGCLTQRYGAEVVERVPGIDAILGTQHWMDLVPLIRLVRAGRYPHPPSAPQHVAAYPRDDAQTHRVATSGVSAYLKLADGCRRPCAFCAIPLIKGSTTSRDPAAIIEDAKHLAGVGVRELVLIAQDTTDYGHDLGMPDGLPDLLEQIAAATPEVDWIRVMYAYPGRVSERLVETMARCEKVVHYLDMPLQHSHPATLRRMRRPSNTRKVRETIARLRDAMPDIALRTTFLVGYPGETEAEFDSLLGFVEEIGFDRVGVFEFSLEHGTASEVLGNRVSDQVKYERRDRLMSLQQQISLARNQMFVGRTLQVLIEGRGDGIAVGRSYRDAPEVDGLVVVDSECEVGALVPVRVAEADHYDLYGSQAAHAK